MVVRMSVAQHQVTKAVKFPLSIFGKDLNRSRFAQGGHCTPQLWDSMTRMHGCTHVHTLQLLDPPCPEVLTRNSEADGPTAGNDKKTTESKNILSLPWNRKSLMQIPLIRWTVTLAHSTTAGGRYGRHTLLCLSFLL